MATVPIKLEGRLDGRGLCLLVHRFKENCSTIACSGVNVDFTHLTFVTPAGVTFLSNFMRWLQNQGLKVSISGVQRQQAAIVYLDDSLFFEQHTGSKLRPNANCRATTIPLCAVDSAQAHHWVDTKLMPWMSETLGRPRSSLYPIEASIAEVFNNIRDHSSQIIGSVFAQHFPKLNELNITIADFGRGIPEAVRTVYPRLTASECIVKAVERGFTTKSTRNNAGQGLDYLLNSTVLEKSGEVLIHSLNGHVLFSNSKGAVTHQVLTYVGFCPGTIIDITLKTNTIPYAEAEPEDLIW